MKRILCILLITIIFHSCEFGTENKENNKLIETAPIPQFIAYDIKAINEQKGPCTANEDSKQCISFMIEYPVLTDSLSGEVIEKVNEDIENEIFSFITLGDDKSRSIETLLEDYATSYDSLITAYPEYQNEWLVEVNGDVLYQQAEFISVAISVFTYTGGAHPNSQQIYRSYDLETGEAITLDDLMISGYQKNLFESAEIEFRMDKQIPPSRSLREEGYWFEDDEFRLNDNFAIINKSLIFYFNPYEIGPYSLGPTELELKPTDYIELINQNGPIGELKN